MQQKHSNEILENKGSKISFVGEGVTKECTVRVFEKENLIHQ